MPLLSLLGWLLLTSTAPSHAAEKTFHYEPESSVLEGVLSRETLPGPPNYEDVKKGDVPETYWILNLSQPISVEVKKGTKDEFNESDMGVKRLQLLIDYDRCSSLRLFGLKTCVSATHPQKKPLKIKAHCDGRSVAIGYQ